MKYIIRKAIPSDAAAIAEINVMGWRFAYSHFIPKEFLDGFSVEVKAKEWRGRLKKPIPDSNTIVCEVDGDVVGFTSYGKTRDDCDNLEDIAELYGIYVLPDCIRQGYGNALLQYVLQDVKSRGFKEITLWVLEGNDIGRSFYEKHGFTQEPNVIEYYEEKEFKLPELRYRLKLV